MDDIKFANFEVNMEVDKRINSNLGRVKVMVCHTGKNLNYSKFSRESLEKALTSLEGIPLVGEYKEEKEDFGAHGGKIEITDDSFKWTETTRPYGFIPFGDLANIRFETIMDKDGITEKEWLVADAYIWYKKYPEIERIFEGNNNQSMEISVDNYNYDEDGYLDITAFQFLALCVLGENVSPAMAGAKIQGYSEFKAEFQVMLNEAMSELKEVIDVKYEENKPEETDVKVDETEVKADEVVEPEVVEEVENAESNEEVKTDETVEKPVEVEVVTEDQYEVEVLDFAYDVLKDEFLKLQELYTVSVSEKDALQSKVAEYQKAEKQEQLDSLYAEFSELDEEEINSVKEKAMEMSIDEVETILFSMLGRKQKQINFSKKTVSDVVPVATHEADVDEPYKSLSKYKK